MTTKLTDTQLVLLSASAQRDTKALLPFPKSLKAKGAALTRTIEKLLRHRLIEERNVNGKEPHWRRDDEDGALGLFLTEQGLAALDGPAVDRTSRAKPASAKPAARDKETGSPKKPAKQRSRKRAGAGKRGMTSKQDKVLTLLRRKNGATLSDICAETGWQAHSARGFLSAVVRKKLGLALLSEKGGDDGVRRYRIDEDKKAG